MKALLAALGVLGFGAAVFFIARGKSVPNTSGKQASGNTGQPQSSKSIAANLLTSQNISTLGGLVAKLGGGPAEVAKPAGKDGSLFITSLD